MLEVAVTQSHAGIIALGIGTANRQLRSLMGLNFAHDVPNSLSPPPPVTRATGEPHPAGPPGIASAVPYAITRVAGRAAAGNTDFVGNVSFLIEIEGEQYQVDGVGALDGIGVRFYQKDEDHDGRDIRIWQIRAIPGSGFMAEHAAAI